MHGIYCDHNYGQGRSYGPPKIFKNYFILCISIKIFKYLATKIEVGPTPNV